MRAVAEVVRRSLELGAIMAVGDGSWRWENGFTGAQLTIELV